MANTSRSQVKLNLGLELLEAKLALAESQDEHVDAAKLRVQVLEHKVALAVARADNPAVLSLRVDLAEARIALDGLADNASGVDAVDATQTSSAGQVHLLDLAGAMADAAAPGDGGECLSAPFLLYTDTGA